LKNVAGGTGGGTLEEQLHAAEWRVRKEAIEELARVAETEAVVALMRTLRDPDPGLREAAARAIGEQRVKAALRPLTDAALEDASWCVRLAAVEALGRLGPEAVPELIPALGDEEEVIQARAARLLGELGDERAFDPLLRCFKDRSWRVRQGAAYGLGKLGHPEALKSLMRLTRDKERMVRSAAARALGELADAHAVGPLNRLLGDESQTVRREAAWALQQIGTPGALAALEAYHKRSRHSRRSREEERE
jgi:HEAT repeat protein